MSIMQEKVVTSRDAPIHFFFFCDMIQSTDPTLIHKVNQFPRTFFYYLVLVLPKAQQRSIQNLKAHL